MLHADNLLLQTRDVDCAEAIYVYDPEIDADIDHCSPPAAADAGDKKPLAARLDVVVQLSQCAENQKMRRGDIHHTRWLLNKFLLDKLLLGQSHSRIKPFSKIDLLCLEERADHHF